MSFYLDLGECYNVQPTYRIGFNQYPITNTIILIEWSTQKTVWRKRLIIFVFQMYLSYEIHNCSDFFTLINI